MTQKQAFIRLQLAILLLQINYHCVDMAESISVGLTDEEIEACKLIASSALA